MNKLFLTLLFVFLCAAQLVAQQQLPTLNLIALDENGPTFTAIAGSEAMPIGFNIMITDAGGGLINVDKFPVTRHPECSSFALEAFETSPEFQIVPDPALNEDECQQPRNFNILACGASYGYTLHVRNSKTRSAAVILQLPCQ